MESIPTRLGVLFEAEFIVKNATMFPDFLKYDHISRRCHKAAVLYMHVPSSFCQWVLYRNVNRLRRELRLHDQSGLVRCSGSILMRVCLHADITLVISSAG